MSCILDEYEPYWCEADWNCKDCPNWVEDKEGESEDKMGMTIDKIIKRLLWFEDYNEEDYCGGDRIQDKHGDWFYKVTEEDFEAFRKAADTMRKYQEIEQILDDCDLEAWEVLEKIKEVVEDGECK